MKISLSKLLSSIIDIFVLGVSVSLLLAIGVFGIRPVIVLSGSMHPSIPTGSMAALDTRAEYKDVAVGDVITFQIKTGQQVTHRVVEIKEEGIVTKGDANKTSDGVSVTEENFIGKVLFTVPNAGYVLEFMRTKNGTVVIGIIFTILVLLSFSSRKEQRKECAVKRNKRCEKK